MQKLDMKNYMTYMCLCSKSEIMYKWNIIIIAVKPDWNSGIGQNYNKFSSEGEIP